MCLCFCKGTYDGLKGKKKRNMKILAIDSSAVAGSAALLEDEKLTAYTQILTGNTHSETLLVIIDELLKKASWQIKDIDLFAVTVGPGSFTGVRIGVSLIKGLSFGREKPSCVGVSTLSALANNLSDRQGIICAVMDARRSQLYNALFRVENGSITRLCDDRLISASQLGKELEGYADKDIFICGDGVKVFLEEICLPNIKRVNRLCEYQSAYSVGVCALEEYKKGNVFSDVGLLPVYLRPSQAERERNEKSNKSEDK